jgi:metal-responsive CopG/Arc/MetJ family transcriptional regulator
MLQPTPRLDARLPGVAISKRMQDRLQSVSEATGISISELVRRAVTLFLSEYAQGASNDANQESEGS